MLPSVRNPSVNIEMPVSEGGNSSTVRLRVGQTPVLRSTPLGT